MELLGLRKPLQLAQFRPALAMNPALEARYQANRLRVVRQVHYSLHHENSLDLTLFLNGLPVATAELKTDFTQCVEDAVDQYRFDRDPKPKGKGQPEPLLAFPSGALVHFAISNSRVAMRTRLQGPGTRFLPFDRGDAGGAGNPPNPSGHRTAYLWESVWERESWLEILGRYLVAQRDHKKRIDTIVFPRFHQLDATRKLVATVLAEGPGGLYLVQHSAGSGKTNSIARAAHFLADLHDADNRKLFDTVLVVSDRTVLDDQLADAMFGFERTAGVVAVITRDSGSKSGELARALAGGKKIVVCTIQTFPFAIQAVRELAATQGKRFAVIADEAHSSQTGEAAAKLRELLSTQELADLADGGELGTEDLLAAQMTARAGAGESGITYIAFTATPKAKTLELFGRRPAPLLPPGPDNLPATFHVYSMRQTIEEGFILDVLRNYTPYKLAFRLAALGPGGDWDQAEQDVVRDEALKGVLRWVRLHLDFVNEPDDILTAFKPCYETATRAGVTDPNLIYDLRARLDAAGDYDDFEIERVVAVELNPRATQAQLAAALEPVADRLLRPFKAQREALDAAKARGDAAAVQVAQDAMNALILFNRNLGAYLRVYAFLSQIFDYGNAAIEKRAIFYKRLLPLLELGRAREGVDLSQDERDHRRLRRPRHHEQAGTGLRAGAPRSPGHPAGTRADLGSAARARQRASVGLPFVGRKEALRGL
ncbi:type I restriction endonuclease [uncultured Thiodictyon sp.]|uniref:type I restriction endonuclease n=1 Tax=uncultured Thiodictyon sp. TaxID=1846217 RepID=UPI0025DECC53|nr:type I restriction endonuclease [uncultured Thiodictyon sp.]